jgi:phenylpropionate dioxygenase-like ring-hydroxylating dioxygenase large terminal subunit
MTAVDSRADAEVDTSAVPFAVRDPLRIPRERYYDRGFSELENRGLWARTWQMACRLEEIPRPNDFTEYEIGTDSVLLVRQADLSVKAFHNACRHRATQLEKGSGRLAGGQLVCPFHGWRWDADGSSSFVYGREGFDPECLRPDDLRLRECRVEVLGGCAWINLDPDAGPLRAALAPVVDLLDALGWENWQVKWWKEVVIEANWKLAQEAFMEGYHVPQTHPQLAFGLPIEDYPLDSTTYVVHPNGHSHFQNDTGGAPDLDAFLMAGRMLADGQDAMTLERDLMVLGALRNRLRPGDDVRKAVVDALREHAEGAGIPWKPGMSDSPLFTSGEVFVFPNLFFLPQYQNALAYRIRPFGDDPQRCRFEVWSLTTYPESEVRPRAELLGRFAKDDTTNWGLIPLQDFSNIERQQAGLRTTGFESLRLATRWEAAIATMHRELDRRLARP